MFGFCGWITQKKLPPLTRVCPTMTGDGDSNQAAKKKRDVQSRSVRLPGCADINLWFSLSGMHLLQKKKDVLVRCFRRRHVFFDKEQIYY
jgi:hypothetical protein